MKNNWYVYRHRRLDTNEVFYVGIGKTLNFKRAYSKSYRNKYWYNITNKSKYSVEILQQNLIWEDVTELEIFLISLYGRKDLELGTLVNMTDGGDGHKGMSKENRLRLSTIHKGKEGMKGKDNPMYGKIGNLSPNFGVIRSEDYKNKISKANKGKKHTEIWKELHSSRMTGSGNSKAKKVINKITKEIFDCAKYVPINMRYKLFINRLNGRTLNNTDFLYLDDYLQKFKDVGKLKNL